MQVMIKSLPESMTKAFGMNPAQFINILGFYSIYYGMHIMILSGCFIITLSGNILSKEEREGTADFLLTRPLTRATIFGNKVLVLLSFFTLFWILQILVAVLFINFVSTENLDGTTLAILNFYGLSLNFFFAGLGLLLSLLPKKSKSLTGALVGIVVGSFVLNALSRISDKSEWIGWISLFHYADFEVATTGYGFEFWRFLILIGGGIASFIASFFIFRNKDILI